MEIIIKSAYGEIPEIKTTLSELKQEIKRIYKNFWDYCNFMESESLTDKDVFGEIDNAYRWCEKQTSPNRYSGECFDIFVTSEENKI